ncbi:MAG: imidazolonepropionase [Bdellovibrionaceae bacterium]|nr:imidazolonepropionase [Pseudobdellovibrionaceae bacterium]
MMQVIRGAEEALTLKGVVQKDGRHVIEKDLGILSKPVVVKDKKQLLFVGTEKTFDTYYKQNKKQFKEYEKKKKLKEIHLDGGSLLPGFVESHTHSIFAGNRQNEFELRNQGVSYQEIAAQGGGIAYSVKQTRAASQDELEQTAQTRAKLFKAQGVVLLESKSGYGLEHKTEVKSLKAIHKMKLKGMNIVSTYLGLHGVPQGKDKSEYLQECFTKTIPYLAQNHLCQRADIFVEKNYFDTQDLEKLVEVIRPYGWSFCVHAEQLSHSGGIRKAVELGAQSVEHCVEASEDDIKALVKSSTVANLLPAADFYLRMKYPPARKMLDAGVKVALATDFNPGTSPTQSLNFVGVLSRLEMQMSRAEVLAAYTFNAASVLGKQKRYGALIDGYSSDILHSESSWADLFYQVGSSDQLNVL